MFIFVGMIISYFYFMVVISDSDQVYSLKKMAVSSHEIKYQLINIFTLIECDYHFAFHSFSINRRLSRAKCLYSAPSWFADCFFLEIICCRTKESEHSMRFLTNKD